MVSLEERWRGGRTELREEEVTAERAEVADAGIEERRGEECLPDCLPAIAAAAATFGLLG